jgi:MGT family glycosyltransferase
MSTILAYTSPARGHLYPMMDVLGELEERGHRVVVQTLASEAEYLEREGIEHRPIAPDIEALELEDYKGSNPLGQMRIALETWLRRAPFEVEDLRASFEELDPDFVLIDANTFGGSAFAETAGRRWALHMPYCLPTPSRDAPAFGPGFAPPRSIFGRARDAMVRGVTNRAISGTLRRINEFRAQHGAPRVDDFAGVYDAPPSILYRTAEPFEYPRSDWADNVEPLGPGLWSPPAELPDWVLALPEPRVLVSISTEAQKDGAIVEVALEALADEPGSVICTTSAEDPGRFSAPSDNVRICRFLPHAQVMPHVECVVTHGGMGTVQRALANGVPICVVPWGRDQSESAQRTVEAGAGTRLAPSKLTPARLRAAVREAMHKKQGATRVAEGFRQAGGASRGADIIEDSLR